MGASITLLMFGDTTSGQSRRLMVVWTDFYFSCARASCASCLIVISETFGRRNEKMKENEGKMNGKVERRIVVD